MMVKSSSELLGVKFGRDPLTLIRPDFIIKQISQGFLFPFSTNIITIKIKTNCDFSMGSVITIVGLTGTLTPDETSKRVFGDYTNWFDAQRTTWSQERGMLKL